MTIPEQEILNSLVARIFRTTDVTLGREGTEFLYRYRGTLNTEDSAAAYDQLAESLRPYELRPLFRKDEEGGHLILLVPAVPRPKPFNIRTNIFMFTLTVISVFLSGALYVYLGLHPETNITSIPQTYVIAIQNIWIGWPFVVSLLAILLAHEFGHYLAGRYHKVALTLPYFIPLPFPAGIGTMGAVIQMKEIPKNKRILLDIGLAGPLAGLVVAIPVLLIGLHMSVLQQNIPNSTGFEGNSILYLLLKYITFGQLLPAPASYGNIPPTLYWLQYFFTGTPAPMGGTDVILSPVAWAGWIGLLVTSLNLIPAGQLDGGHLMYVLFGGKRLRSWLPIIQLVLAVLGFFSVSWWLWLAILSFFGRFTDEPLDQITELDPRRRALAIFGVIVFILVFMPVPFPATIFDLFK